MSFRNDVWDAIAFDPVFRTWFSSTWSLDVAHFDVTKTAAVAPDGPCLESGLSRLVSRLDARQGTIGQIALAERHRLCYTRPSLWCEQALA